LPVTSCRSPTTLFVRVVAAIRVHTPGREGAAGRHADRAAGSVPRRQRGRGVVKLRHRPWLALLPCVVGFIAVLAGHASAAEDRCIEPRQELAAARAQLDSRVQAVRNMGFATTAETLEQWAELTEGARKQFEKYVFAATRDVMFTGAEQAIKRRAS